MFKKTMTYTDYDGNQRTEDFFFNLTRAECMEMNFSETGGLEKMLRKIIAEQDSKRIVEVFKEIVLKAYGEKSPDGRRFIKTPEITEAFSQTEAYSDLFIELATNAEAASAFINGIIPANLVPADQPANLSAI